MRVSAREGDEARRAGRSGARGCRTAWRARRSSGPRASRRRARRAARPRPARPRTPGIGMNSVAWRLPSVIVPVLSSSSTSTSPDASTARPDSASTLRRTSRSMPAMPIADSSAPIVVGISDDEQRDQRGDRGVGVRELGERPQGHDDGEEDDREAGEQDVERDLVRRLAPLGALDERDHAVEEALARLLRDLDHDPVGEHARAAGDRAAVAAGLADHRGGLARDRRTRRPRRCPRSRCRRRGSPRRPRRPRRRRARAPRPASRRRRAGARPSPCASRAARRPGPCRGPRPAPRRGWRTRP